MTSAPEHVFLNDRLDWWAEQTPDAEAMSYLGRTWTWSQWRDRVQRAAGALKELGVGRGDVVAFLDKNHPACVEVTMACSLIGAANAIVNWRLAPDEVDYTVNDSGAKVLFVGSELLPLVEKVRDRLPHVERVVEVTPDGAEGDEYEALLAAATASGRDPASTPDDVCLVMYSSGTTGRPKGVMITQRNLVEHTLNTVFFDWDPGDKHLIAMPLFHVGGSSSVQLGIHLGHGTVMTREADGPSLAGAIMAGANRAFLVPAVVAQIMQAGPDAVALFSRLKHFCYGASPMPLPLLRAAMDAWPDTDFLQVYGLTEVAGVATVLLPEDHRDSSHPERWTSAGRPIAGCELRIVDPATLADVPPGEHGEIWLRTAQVMKGFLGKPEATAEVLTEDGWFRTGDIGRVDEDGYVYIEDRLKDMIISGGENIYSPEIERVLAEHPAVAEVAVIGVPDERWGEQVKAVVALKPGAEATEQELVAHCHEHLASFKCPRSVDVLDALPRNPTGKILKRQLRQPYWEGRDRVIG
ncbi:MAG TPA: long-chain-fatty-acid--CoA ligase [Marmoricola sp.]|nr:long-chain-fatty-acid--CoA ligase [Marmoricola sp.]